MKISKSSWHYRFMTAMKVYPYYRRNLCEYMRGFVLALLKAILFMGAGACGVVFVAVLTYCLLYVLLTPLLGLDTSHFPWVLGSALWTAACVLAWWHVLEQVMDRREDRPAGPFKQYLRDRHDKVCRMITFD